MQISLNNIQQHIPLTSKRVKSLFEQVVTPETVTWGGRYGYATGAICLSMFNVFFYGLSVPARPLTALVSLNFQNCMKKCQTDATNAFHSLYFVAAMSTYLFLSLIPHLGYDLQLSNLSEEPKHQENSDPKPSLTSPDIPQLEEPKHQENSKRTPPTSYSDISKSEPPKPQEDSKPTDPTPSSQTSASTSSTEKHLTESFVNIENPDLSSIKSEKPSLYERCKETIVGVDTLPKKMKYRHIFAHYSKIVSEESEGMELYGAIERILKKSELYTKCIQLYNIITNTPKTEERIQERHKQFIRILREAQVLIQNDSKCDIQYKNWIQFLALNRFAGIKLYGYCKSLVEKSSGPFKKPITLQNFWNELESRNKELQKLSPAEGLPHLVRTLENLKGHLNQKDFLMGSNIPYIYGHLQRKKKTIVILRHGVPIHHSESAWAPLRRAVWGPNGNCIPEINPDYIAFILAAKEKGKNILHVILENGEIKSHGDESARVQARLALGDKHTNFFPLALRLDGTYFKPPNYASKNLSAVQEKFCNQLFDEKESFFIPAKLKDTFLTRDKALECMKNIEKMFFSAHENLETLGQFQAFHLLTYAEMILYICDSANIDYLEALCKDDIDRGGVMKATLVLLHLYHTGKFADSSQEELSTALEQLMVNIVAAPLIVKKQAILHSRAILIQHVLDVLNSAIAIQSHPINRIEGNFNIVTELEQDLDPRGNTSYTKQEYNNFIEKMKKTGFQCNLEMNTIEDCIKKNNSQGFISNQIKRDLEGQYMHYNNTLLNPKHQKGEVNFEEVPNFLIQKLQEQQINSIEGWKILSAYNQTIGADLYQKLQPLFNNSSLQYTLLMDAERTYKDENSGLHLKAGHGTASLELVTYFKVCDLSDNTLIATVWAHFSIPDYKVNKQIICVKVV